VNISLGIDTLESEKIIKNLKQKEIINIDQFEENNPEVNLPGELSVEDLVAECTTVNAENQTPLKEDNDLVNQTWAQVVSTGKPKPKSQKLTMIGAFWNIRGLNKEGRLQCITDFVKDHRLDFMGFQETKKESFTDSFLNYVNKGFIWQILPVKGTAGGILIGLNEKKFDVIAWKIGSFSVADERS
jgi:hypothetical protein